MSHIVLLGDSVFDNAAYVAAGAPDVVKQLRQRLPDGWKATLLAVDGSVTRDVQRQAAQIPRDATHLILSCGGNDALGHMGLLDEPARSMTEALTRLAEAGANFQQHYRAMLDALLCTDLPLGVCSIYYPRFPDPQLQRLAVTALTIFNDAIIREVFARRIPLLDLRLICDEDGDYANPIEPSARGGEKIAAAIERLAAEHNFTRHRTEVFV
ncbi:MAG: SGNH/GDSL hydrolase family protein [Pyrinomonadaceae bacterium]